MRTFNPTSQTLSILTVNFILFLWMALLDRNQTALQVLQGLSIVILFVLSINLNHLFLEEAATVFLFVGAMSLPFESKMGMMLGHTSWILVFCALSARCLWLGAQKNQWLPFFITLAMTACALMLTPGLPTAPFLRSYIYVVLLSYAVLFLSWLVLMYSNTIDKKKS